MTISYIGSNLRAVDASTTGTSSSVMSPTTGSSLGNTLILIIGTRAVSGTTVTSVTDSQGNTWTVDSTVTSANSNSITIASTRQNVAALSTSDTITANFSNSHTNTVAWDLREFAGVVQSSYANGTSSNVSSSFTGAVDCGAITPTVDGDLMIFGATLNTSTGPTITMNATGTVGTYLDISQQATSSGSNKATLGGYQILSTGSGTAQKFDFSINTSGESYQGIFVAYKAGTVNRTGSDAASGADGATVATGAADSASGADTASILNVVIVSDAVSGSESATLKVNAATDTGTAVETTDVVDSGGAHIRGGVDSGAAADTALPAVSGTDSASSIDTSFVGITGPLPPGQRIARIQPESRTLYITPP